MRLALLAFFALLVACTHAPPDATPEGAVREWLAHMEAAEGDARETRAAWELMGPSARANLEERARRASQVVGQKVEPHEMIAEGHFGLRFRPRKMKGAHGDPGTAVVVITGEGDAERAEIRCVKDGAVWRVEPVLPEPQALSKRDAG